MSFSLEKSISQNLEKCARKLTLYIAHHSNTARAASHNLTCSYFCTNSVKSLTKWNKERLQITVCQFRASVFTYEVPYKAHQKPYFSELCRIGAKELSLCQTSWSYCLLLKATCISVAQQVTLSSNQTNSSSAFTESLKQQDFPEFSMIIKIQILQVRIGGFILTYRLFNSKVSATLILKKECSSYLKKRYYHPSQLSLCLEEILLPVHFVLSPLSVPKEWPGILYNLS